MKKIEKVAKSLGVPSKKLQLFDDNKAKIFGAGKKQKSNLILVTATNPTPFGEGKTTVSIALNDALNLLKKKSVLSLREPSLGPVFGIKGGAIGGGKASLVDGNSINLHFTGDFHAITSANNLLVAIIHNHIFQGNTLKIDKENIFIKRCLDVNDRELRPDFVITAASDMMAIVCMSESIEDLRKRLDQTVIALNSKGSYITVEDLKCTDALIALLKDAMKPNLTMSLEGSPVVIHGGPFANIALGCSSIIATKTALSYADYVITESGFGSDLGAEKFLNIKSRIFKLPIQQAVLVTTIRSLKYNSTLENKSAHLSNIRSGIANLERHIQNLKNFGLHVTVALNIFDGDSKTEIDFLTDYFDATYCRVIPCYPYSRGGKGCLNLAKELLQYESELPTILHTYSLEDTLSAKVKKVVQKVYKGKDVIYSDQAKKKLKMLQKKYGLLPICIAKTQYSFSDDEKKLGAPENFLFQVNDIKLNSGAGFIIIQAGKIMLMPGLGKDSRYQKVKVDKNGNIISL